MIGNSPQLHSELEHRIRSLTGGRIRNLAIEVEAERIVLRGLATSYHVKQLAQHGIRTVLPDVLLENAITVDGSKSRPR